MKLATQKQRQRFGVYDNFSAVVSDVAGLQRYASDAAADLAIFSAPRECYADVACVLQCSMIKTLANARLTPEEFSCELRARLSVKSAHYLSLAVSDITADDVLRCVHSGIDRSRRSKSYRENLELFELGRIYERMLTEERAAQARAQRALTLVEVQQ